MWKEKTSAMSQPVQELSPEAIASFCQRYNIRRMAFFQSILGNDSSSESDIDVLIEFVQGHTPGLAMIRIQQDLSQLLYNCPVSLVTPRFFNQRMRDRMHTGAQAIFADGAVVTTRLPRHPRSIKLMVLDSSLEQIEHH